jgi:amino acid adenylation domain-containing protein
MTRLLQNYATVQATRRPDAIALVLGDEELTYGQLEEQSNRLANLLRESGCRRGDRVCLFLDKTPTAIVAMHGVMKADCIYVPIDVSSPAPRISKIVESCRPRVILLDSSTAKLANEVLPVSTMTSQPVIGSVEPTSIVTDHFQSAFDATDLEGMKAIAPDSKNRPGDPAHILFTSGSTGTPKGVVLSHSNVCHFVDWGREYFRMASGDRVSGHPPLHFDLSTFDIYGTFSAGAQLHLVPAVANLLPTSLAKFIRDSELTQWFSVPSALSLMARGGAIEDNDFSSLKRLLWCGEVLPTPTLIHWMERLPHVEFTNLYGPTETTIASSYFTMKQCPQDSRERIPIGRACDGEELMVLDSDLQPVANGTQGNLYISGVGLCREYWEDTKKTQEVILTRTGINSEPQRVYRTGDLASVGSDGMFHFLGRRDSQIKSRGYRIELGEIETALNSLGILQDSAVVGIPTGGFEGTAICCVFVPQNNDNVSPEFLRTQASKLLPTYMLPKRWKNFKRLPKTGNGKTDRRKIKEIFEAPVSAQLEPQAKPDRLSRSDNPIGPVAHK